MSRGNIMNLRRGLTTCLICGCQYSWDIQTCPHCLRRKEEAHKAQASAIDMAECERHTQTLQREARKVVMVQHIDGAVEIEATWADQTEDYDEFNHTQKEAQS